jgi:flagellar protein FlaG
MGMEAVKGAAMTYQGSVSTAEVKEESRPKVEQSENLTVSESVAKATTALDTKQTSGDGNGEAPQQQNPTYQNTQIKKAVEDINRKANNSEAIFGIHEATNRVMIKIVDKDSKKVIKELPPEKTLDMIAKVWELAGLLVDEKR